MISTACTTCAPRPIRRRWPPRWPCRPGRRPGWSSLGAGWIGLEVAAAAREKGCAVTVLEPEPTALHRQLGPELGEFFADLHRRTAWSSGSARQPPRCTGQDGRVTGVRHLRRGGPARRRGRGGHRRRAVTWRWPRRPGWRWPTGCWSTRRCGPPTRTCSRPVTWPTWRTRCSAAGSGWSTGPTRCNGGPAAARSMLGQPVSYDRVPYYFSDQYDLGMECSGLPEPGFYDQIVYRGERGSAEFIAFWLQGGCVVAGMNVNVWDVTDDIQALIRAGYAGQPADLARLADPSRAAGCGAGLIRPRGRVLRGVLGGREGGQHHGDVVPAARLDGELDQFLGRAERVGQRPGQGQGGQFGRLRLVVPQAIRAQQQNARAGWLERAPRAAAPRPGRRPPSGSPRARAVRCSASDWCSSPALTISWASESSVVSCSAADSGPRPASRPGCRPASTASRPSPVSTAETKVADGTLAPGSASWATACPADCTASGGRLDQVRRRIPPPWSAPGRRPARRPATLRPAGSRWTPRHRPRPR